MEAPRSLLPPLSPLGGGAPPSRSPLPSSSAHHQPRNRKVPHSLPEVVLVVARARRWASSRRPGRRQPPGSRTAAPRAPAARARALHLLAPCTLTHTQEGLPGVVPHERVHPRGTARSPSPLSPPRRAESSSPGRRRRAPRQPAGQHVCTRMNTYVHVRCVPGMIRFILLLRTGRPRRAWPSTTRPRRTLRSAPSSARCAAGWCTAARQVLQLRGVLKLRPTRSNVFKFCLALARSDLNFVYSPKQKVTRFQLGIYHGSETGDSFPGLLGI